MAATECCLEQVLVLGLDQFLVLFVNLNGCFSFHVRLNGLKLPCLTPGQVVKNNMCPTDGNIALPRPVTQPGFKNELPAILRIWEAKSLLTTPSFFSSMRPEAPIVG